MTLNYKNPVEPKKNVPSTSRSKSGHPKDDLRDYTKGIAMPNEKQIAKAMKKSK